MPRKDSKSPLLADSHRMGGTHDVKCTKCGRVYSYHTAVSAEKVNCPDCGTNVAASL